ncbi:hypothetical protein HOF92_15890, partial [bacterium]|nr:hypothetical protein [bacterium]
MKFFRYILISFFFLILCEIALQLLALKTNPYGSYAQFFEQALKKISTQEAKNTVFFVGDSTIYGGGASYEALYSLP